HKAEGRVGPHSRAALSLWAAGKEQQMPGGFGRDSHIGWVEEPTYGTVVTPPTKFEELISQNVEGIRIRTPRPTVRGLDTAEDDLYDEKFGVEGPFNFNINYEGQLRLLEHLFGAVATVVLEAVISWTHTFTLTDALQTGKGLSIYINLDLDEYQCKGCKLSQAVFTFDPKLPATVEFSLVGQDMEGVAASTFVAQANSLYVGGHQLTCEIDDVVRAIDSATLTINNGLDIDKRILGSKSIVEPVRGDTRREITGTLKMDALDTDWDKFQSSLNDVAGGFLNVNSPKQVHSYLYKELGIPVRKKKDPKTGKSRITADEDALRAIMANAEADMAKAKRDETKNRHFRIFLSTKLMLRIRGSRKVLSSYTGCPLECDCKKPSQVHFDDDGRMRCSISVGGTETMRFSHSKTLQETGCNMATIPHKLRP
ncbi:hypothetical protein LCGC14_2278920, partial [marine sediment metagenome]